MLVTLILAALSGLSPAYDTVSLEDVVDPMMPGTSVFMPLYVRDASGTLLGTDVGAGMRIQGMGITFEVSPSGAVDGINVSRAGVTSALSALFEDDALTSGDRFSWIATFDETADPVPFNLDQALPGDQVAKLEVQLSKNLPPETTVFISVVTPTALSNQRGTFVQRQQDSTLELIGGRLIPENVFIFSDGFESGDVSAWTSVTP